MFSDPSQGYPESEKIFSKRNLKRLKKLTDRYKFVMHSLIFLMLAGTAFLIRGIILYVYAILTGKMYHQKMSLAYNQKMFHHQYHLKDDQHLLNPETVTTLPPWAHMNLAEYLADLKAKSDARGVLYPKDYFLNKKKRTKKTNKANKKCIDSKYYLDNKRHLRKNIKKSDLKRYDLLILEKEDYNSTLHRLANIDEIYMRYSGLIRAIGNWGLVRFEAGCLCGNGFSKNLSATGTRTRNKKSSKKYKNISLDPNIYRCSFCSKTLKETVPESESKSTASKSKITDRVFYLGSGPEIDEELEKKLEVTVSQEKKIEFVAEKNMENRAVALTDRVLLDILDSEICDYQFCSEFSGKVIVTYHDC